VGSFTEARHKLLVRSASNFFSSRRACREHPLDELYSGRSETVVRGQRDQEFCLAPNRFAR